MNYRYKIVLYLCLLIISIMGNGTFFQNNRLNSRLINSVSGKIVESGMEYSLQLDDTQNIHMDELIRNIYNKISWSYRKYSGGAEEVAYLDQDNIHASIKIVRGKDTKVFISLSEEGKQQLISKIEKKLDNFVEVKNFNSNSYKYVKVKCMESSMINCEKAIEKTIRNDNGNNIDRIRISNGYSITALIGKGPVKKIGDKLINLNCAICRYNTGTYLVIGSPIISITY
ncbi:hypothetical protein [Clostridium oryzae]|nr:hypothetical protein [Clostridium oryzae]